MNWGKIQIESLKKMFLNSENLKETELETYKTNKKYKTYLFAMPQACNEAIRYINNLIPIVKSYTLKITEERIDLGKKIYGFKSLKNVITDNKWNMETKDVIKFENNYGEAIIYYESYPSTIYSNTSAKEELDVDKDCLIYIPLYIAAELYKDDDLTLSTVYMNEFVSNINAIVNKEQTIVNNKIVPIYTMERW